MNLKEKFLKYQYYPVLSICLIIIITSLIMLVFYSTTDFRKVLHKDIYKVILLLTISLALSRKLFSLHIERPRITRKEHLLFLSIVVVFLLTFSYGAYMTYDSFLNWFDTTNSIEGYLIYYKKDTANENYIFKIDTCPQIWVDGITDIEAEGPPKDGITSAINTDVLITYYKRSKRVYSVNSGNIILFKDDREFIPSSRRY